MVRGGGWMMALETGDEMNKRRLFILKKKGLGREYIINPTWHPPTLQPSSFLCCEYPLHLLCACRAGGVIHCRSPTFLYHHHYHFFFFFFFLLLYSKWDWAERIVVRLNGHGCFRILSAAAASPVESISLSLSLSSILYKYIVRLYMQGRCIVRWGYVCKYNNTAEYHGRNPFVVFRRRIDSNFLLLLYNNLFFSLSFYILM